MRVCESGKTGSPRRAAREGRKGGPLARATREDEEGGRGGVEEEMEEGEGDRARRPCTAVLVRRWELCVRCSSSSSLSAARSLRLRASSALALAFMKKVSADTAPERIAASSAYS